MRIIIENIPFVILCLVIFSENIINLLRNKYYSKKKTIILPAKNERNCFVLNIEAIDKRLRLLCTCTHSNTQETNTRAANVYKWARNKLQISKNVLTTQPEVTFTFT